MFMGLSMRDKLSVFTEEVPIAKGANFYRIRRIDGIKDPNAPKEWEPVPVKFSKKGRFNEKGESVLYVASDPFALEREVRLHKGEEYYLAKYVCNKDFKVGSFLGFNSQVNTLIHKIAMAVSCSDDLTETENELIDEYYECIKNKNLHDLSLDMLSSLYIHRMLPNLYDITNKLAKLVLRNNEYGIRYSSVFAPIELSGSQQIVTLDDIEYGNYVLTKKGYEHIELVSVEKKTVSKIQGLETMISVFAKDELVNWMKNFDVNKMSIKNAESQNNYCNIWKLYTIYSKMENWQILYIVSTKELQSLGSSVENLE